MSDEKKDLIQIGGLWKNKTEDGKTYLAGYLGNARLLIFPHGFKETEKHPDYVMYVAPNKTKSDEDTSFDPDAL